MKQVARQLTNCDDGFLNESHHLLMDGDMKFTAEFQEILKQSGVQPLLLPPLSPNLNAFQERFMRSIKEECLSRMIFFGENALRNAVRAYLAHYHAERNHQRLENQLIDPGEEVGCVAGKIKPASSWADAQVLPLRSGLNAAPALASGALILRAGVAKNRQQTPELGWRPAAAGPNSTARSPKRLNCQRTSARPNIFTLRQETTNH